MLLGNVSMPFAELEGTSAAERIDCRAASWQNLFLLVFGRSGHVEAEGGTAGVRVPASFPSCLDGRGQYCQESLIRGRTIFAEQREGEIQNQFPSAFRLPPYRDGNAFPSRFVVNDTAVAEAPEVLFVTNYNPVCGGCFLCHEYQLNVKEVKERLSDDLARPRCPNAGVVSFI
jgi:hypothetical protein